MKSKSDMEDVILSALENSMERIENGFPISCEADFQSIMFGELYKILPDFIIRFEVRMAGDYQSYIKHGSTAKNRKSRVDIHIASGDNTAVVELKYFKGADKESRADMIADIAKVERIVESAEAQEGFCIQLVKPGVVKRLPSGRVETGRHQALINGWSYDFEIKGNYDIDANVCPDGHAVIFHHVN